ncbi:nitrogenase component 1 [uncultured Thiodictyon sp.]|uniref:nitrogenase component 1 n=1 Tax=uncultured Thiodictyon sp. TaxID=1846217 RepID=UPI0025D3CF52|nr:nitrogenase component 1 [uncultured Thiodictyon sp.]
MRGKTAPIREKRLGAIGAYSGSLSGLLQEVLRGELKQRVRTFAQDGPSDLQVALELLGTIADAAIVVHGPAGCAASLRGGDAGGAGRWLVTGINERESILGAETKLRQAIVQAHRAWSPAAIFVVATPVVAINNDDIETAVIDAREELGIPIVPVYTDGFRSKVAATGYDVSVHALIKHVAPSRPRPRGEHINLLAVAESRHNVDALRGLLAELGLDAQVFPRYGRISEAPQLAEARLSVAIDAGTAGYAGELLEELYDIPFLRLPPPVGIPATARWLDAIAAATGRDAQCPDLIARHTERVAELVQAAGALQRAPLFINLPAGSAFAVAQLAHALDLRVTGCKFSEIGDGDAPALATLLADHGDLPVLVGNGQVFEEANLLGTLKPALYVGSGNRAVHALRLGIPVFDLARRPTLGYAGVESILTGLARTLGKPALAHFLADGGGTDDAYTASWLGKSTHWHVKHESN